MGQTDQTLSAHTLPALLDRMYRGLASHRREIDELNVFPVPDGDTGTNLVQTLRAVVDAAHDPPDDEELSRTVARTAMRSARGNSGVIISQVLHAFADALIETEAISTDAFADMMGRARELAYGAVANPVEGTILTAITAAAEAARTAADGDAPLDVVLEQVAVRVHRAVADTTEQLDVLREAGVVDAGARGFEVVVQAMLGHVTGRPLESPDEMPSHPERAAPPVGSHEGHRYEVQYLLDVDPADTWVAGELRSTLSTLGDSVAVVDGSGQLRVHVHTDVIGPAIEAGVEHGRPSHIEVTDLSAQTAAYWSHADVPVPTPPGGTGAARLACVAVVPGTGLRRLAEEHGAQVVAGHSGDLPSVGELLDVIETLPDVARVILLPGHRNAVATARQAAVTADRDDLPQIVVIEEADSAPAVVAALAVYHPEGDPDGVRDDMREAASACVDGEVVAAVRDASTPLGAVARGQFLAVVQGEVVASVEDPVAALRELVVTAAEPDDVEAVVLIVGEGVDDAELARAEEALGTVVGDAEVEIIHGRQSPTRYLVGIE